MSLSVEVMNDTEINLALSKVLDLVEMEQEREFVSNAELFDQLIQAFSLESDLVPTSVAKDYVGLHLGTLYEDNDFNLLLKSFKNNQKLDAFYALKIIKDAQIIFRNLPNISECELDADSDKGCIVVGDLHGNFNDLCHLIEKYGIPGSHYKFIFNGDIVDRGAKQIEVLLTILYSFLIRPNKVFINRGNHEDISMNSSRHFVPNFLSTCKDSYSKYGLTVFQQANDLFALLPLATSLQTKSNKYKYFVVHGGISDSLDLNYVKSKLDRFSFDKISLVKSSQKNSKLVTEMLWSDPIRVQSGIIYPKEARKSTGCYFNKQRNIGCIFGSDVTEKFCKKYSYNGIIRSHEVRSKGFSEDHPRCFTIFSASYYCGADNYGSVFKFLPNECSFEVYTYKNLPGDLSCLVFERNKFLLKHFKLMIQAKEKSLMNEFKFFDLENSGTIRTDSWAEILSKAFKSEISVRHLKAIKDFLCECDTNLDCVNYKSLFGKDNRKSREENKFYDLVANLFEILDRNNDKKISVTEARHALDVVNQKLGTKFLVNEDCVNFIKRMDKNGDNHVDLDEFMQAFMESENLKNDYDLSDSEDSDDSDVQIFRL